MGRLAGRVAIVTGSGRGLGRAHALFLASQGASVIVNDLGGSRSGEGTSLTPAQQVVEEITAQGGKAVVSGHDITDWQQAEELIKLAVETFGNLHVLVNNAGIIRDRSLANMSEEEWDAVVKVHLKGHAAPTRHALAYWRSLAKAGNPVKASVIHTSSAAGFLGNFGQANYASAKLAVLALSRVVSLEGGSYGVRSNVISPAARTRISQDSIKTDPATEEKAATSGDFDELDPANVSPLVGWLAEENCPADSQIMHIMGEKLIVLSLPPIVHQLKTTGRWTLEALDQALPDHLVKPLTLQDFF